MEVRNLGVRNAIMITFSLDWMARRLFLSHQIEMMTHVMICHYATTAIRCINTHYFSLDSLHTNHEHFLVPLFEESMIFLVLRESGQSKTKSDKIAIFQSCPVNFIRADNSQIVGHLRMTRSILVDYSLVAGEALISNVYEQPACSVRPLNYRT